MEESGHVAVALLAHVGDGLDDVGRHIGADDSQELQLVAIGVPKGGFGIIAEVGTHHIAAHVAVLSVDVAAQHRPQEGAVEGAVEQPLLALGTALDPDVRQYSLPGGIGLLAHRQEGAACHLGLQIEPCILDAHKGESDAQFEGRLSAVVLKVNHGHTMLVVLHHAHALDRQ